MQKPKSKKEIIKIMLICVLTLVFIFSGYKIITMLNEYTVNEEEYGGLVNSAVTVLSAETDIGDGVPSKQEEEKSISETPPISVDFEKLKAINPNCVAWIYAEGTPINYPIVKTESYADYDHYLTHTFSGKANKAGTIFIDYRNSETNKFFNTITYGHSMKNGSMYAYLLRYKNQSFYDAHPFIWLYTGDGSIYKIELISGREVPETSQDYSVYSDRESFDNYLKDSIENSDFKTKFETSSIDKIVTLSTCSYGGENLRYVVLGKLTIYKN